MQQAMPREGGRVRIIGAENAADRRRFAGRTGTVVDDAPDGDGSFRVEIDGLPAGANTFFFLPRHWQPIDAPIPARARRWPVVAAALAATSVAAGAASEIAVLALFGAALFLAVTGGMIYMALRERLLR